MADAMTMRNCLESMVKTFDEGEIEHVLLTTFNFDPSFFERNVLPLLCGFSMEDIKTKSFDVLSREMFLPLKKMKVIVAYDQAVMQGASEGGVRYSFLPRYQVNGFFHAKLIVIAGVDAQKNSVARVMVSSGNLTLSGWGSNIEVAAWVEVNQENALELLGFYKYLNHTDLKSGIDRLQNISSNEESPKLFLQYPGADRATLFDRLFESRLSGDVHIYSPYWSEEAIKLFGSDVNLHCYPALGAKGYNFPVTTEKVPQTNLHVCAIPGEESFRHAKAYFWGKYMAIGSANCTLQALSTKSNVEAMLLFEGHRWEKSTSVQLDDWSSDLDVEEGSVMVPIMALVIADYERRVYRVSIDISNQDRCNCWQLRLGEIRLEGVAKMENEIPFEKGAVVARIFQIIWENDDGSQYLTGMVIPCNGSDVELGYRPKRHLDKIFQDMLLYKTPDGGNVTQLAEVPDDEDESGNEVQSDDSELLDPNDEFEFDMYGMYQSFYHLRKRFYQSGLGKIPSWKYEELADTLLEILTAIKDGEVKNRVQQWLIVQEALDLTQKLPEDQLKKFVFFGEIQRGLNQDLERILKTDETMKAYKITPESLLVWINKELGYAGK